MFIKAYLELLMLVYSDVWDEDDPKKPFMMK